MDEFANYVAHMARVPTVLGRRWDIQQLKSIAHCSFKSHDDRRQARTGTWYLQILTWLPKSSKNGQHMRNLNVVCTNLLNLILLKDRVCFLGESGFYQVWEIIWAS